MEKINIEFWDELENDNNYHIYSQEMFNQSMLEFIKEIRDKKLESLLRDE